MSTTPPTERPSKARIALLVALLGCLGGLALQARSRLADQEALERTCALEQAGDHLGAVTASDALAERAEGSSAVDLAGCRCEALLALSRGRECRDLIVRIEGRDDLNVEAATGALYVALDAGDAQGALRWARILAERFPPSPTGLAGELAARADLEAPGAISDALAPRIAALPPEETAKVRQALAVRLAQAGDTDLALRTLEPPDTSDLENWFMLRANFLADARRQLDLVHNFERWESMGGRPGRLLLEYALTVEEAGLEDAERGPLELYAQAIAAADPTLDRDLLSSTYVRLVGILVVSGRVPEARQRLAEARAMGLDVPLSDEEIARMGQAPADDSGLARLRFELPGQQPGDVLRVAPADDAPADSPYELVPLDGRSPVVQRKPGDTPIRWVWSDAAGAPLASGAWWPAAGQTAQASVVGRPVSPPRPPPFTWAPGPADGHPDVYVIILDCGDWRLVRYLQARGELPVISTLEAAGRAGVLTSVPAMTGTAMEKLTRPRVASTFSFLGYLDHMGAEIGGLSSVGHNPLEGLRWVLPDNPYILDLVGATDKVGANMLFSHGEKIEAGRNAELVGPRGARSTLDGLVLRRPLRPDELAVVHGEDPVPDTVQDIAAELDSAVQLIQRRDIDLLLLRVEPVDLLTHRFYSFTAVAGRDDGQPYLYQVYRYLDLRLREVADAVDQDDVLIVMSDHGIQASMLHDPEAMFIAAGTGAPAGRLEGGPEIAGLPRALLDRLGVAVPEGWPDTGLSEALRP